MATCGILHDIEIIACCAEIRVRNTFALIFGLLALLNIHAQTEGQSPALWWSVAPGATLPVGLNSSYFSTGVTVDISGEYVHPALLGFAPLVRADFRYLPLSLGGVGGFYEAAASLGATYRMHLFGPLSGRVFADLGYSFVDLIEYVTSSPGYYFENNGFAEGGGRPLLRAQSQRRPAT
jgi:hypothetical protein